MIRILRRHGRWLIVAAAVVLVALLRATGALDGLENAAADARARLLAHEVDSDILIIGVDGRSIEALEGWPWPRNVHARLLGRVFEGDAPPSRVFIDIDFSSPQGDLDDAVFENALRTAKVPVHLAAFFSHTSGERDDMVVVKPLARFQRHASLASVNRIAAADSLTRVWHTSLAFGDEELRSVIDPAGRLGPGRDVIIDYSISPKSIQHVSYVDVLEGRVPAATFAGKDVFIGNMAVELGDAVAVPVYTSLFGVEVQALATETVRRGAPIQPPAWMSFLLLLLWGVAAALSFGTASRRNLVALALLVSGIAGVSTLAFASARLWLDAAAPALVMLLSYVAMTLLAVDRQTSRALLFSLGLRRRDALLRSIVQSSTDCIVCIDERGIIRTANPAAAKLFGCAAGSLPGEAAGKFISLPDGAAGASLAALDGQVRECDARNAAGEEFPVEISVSRVRSSREQLFTAFVRDIRERRAQQLRLQHQATHDALTGLANRPALMAHLQSAAGGGVPSGVVLLMLDLCRFKEVNDALGHEVGDSVLCEVAQRFAKCVGRNGFVARIGGDEFTVVLEQGTSGDPAAAIALALADCLRVPIEVAGIAIEVGVSIGTARLPEDAADAQALLRNADVAMYSAKRRGTSFERYDAATDADSLRRLAIGGELRTAIASNALELHFQPQVNLQSGRAEACEALVRWTHPVHGAVPPMEFITIAETSDLIRPLTGWTLRGALRQLRSWRERGLEMRVAVNLSARLLQDTSFPALLESLLRDSGVQPGSLELEITESAMMMDPARALRVVQDIHALGVLISIDDYGTGFSSLGYLRDLPVHALKLDKSFVMGMCNSEDDRIIVESTAQMAHGLGLELVAEGVEGEWEAGVLAAAGYDFAQGFHYSRALPADKCYAWIIEFNAAASLREASVAV